MIIQENSKVPEIFCQPKVQNFVKFLVSESYFFNQVRSGMDCAHTGGFKIFNKIPDLAGEFNFIKMSPTMTRELHVEVALQKKALGNPP